MLLSMSISSAWAEPALSGPGKMTNVAGIPGKRGFFGEGTDAQHARLASPLGLAIDKAHFIYIADTLNHRVRRINPRTGFIETIVGTGKKGFYNDGGHANMAGLTGPTALVLDGKGNLYIADTGNQRIRVLKPTGYLYTVAGNGRRGFEGDGSQATNTALNNPTGITIGPDGDLYIADTGNNRVRKVEIKTGLISTIAGLGERGDSGDQGLAINARLNQPSALVFDQYGDLFIADTGNHKVRFIDAETKEIYTAVGTGQKGFSGDDSNRSWNCMFFNPSGLAIDNKYDHLYVSDTNNQRIRRVTFDIENLTSRVKTVVGNGRRGYNGTNMDAWEAELAYPGAMVITPHGFLYFLDTGNNVLRRVENISTVVPPTSYTQYGQPVEETDNRGFMEVLFKPQMDHLQAQ